VLENVFFICKVKNIFKAPNKWDHRKPTSKRTRSLIDPADSSNTNTVKVYLFFMKEELASLKRTL